MTFRSLRRRSLSWHSTSRRPYLSAPGVTVASNRMQVTPSRTRPAIRIPGMVPSHASIPVHADRLAAFTALAIQACARNPPEAISSSIWQAVGTEATGPSSCF